MYIIGILIFLMAVIFGLVLNGVSPMQILDPASLIVVLLPAYGAAVFAAGFKGVGQAHRAAFGKEPHVPEESASAVSLFRLMGSVTLGVGFLGFVIGLLQILLHLAPTPDKTMLVYIGGLGRGLAAAVLPIPYALILKYAFFEPAAVRIARRRSTNQPE